MKFLLLSAVFFEWVLLVGPIIWHNIMAHAYQALATI